MAALRQAASPFVRSCRTRVFWPGLAGGVATALGLHLAFMFVATAMGGSDNSGLDPRLAHDSGTAAMVMASIACLAAGGISGILAARSLRRHVALNAYLAWGLASAVLMVNIALTTSAVA